MSDKRRRKSLSIFRPTLTALTSSHSTPSQADGPSSTIKKNRPASILTPISTASSPTSPQVESPQLQDGGKAESPKSRPKTLQKGPRASVFGSFRSLHSLEDDYKLTRMNSKASSADDEDFLAENGPGSLGRVVLHHGEVQSSGGMFRKKSQYLVLTDTHLVRFKNQAKASEAFSSIPASVGRSNPARHSMASISSFQEQASVSGEAMPSIPLQNVIAVYKLDDGRPYFSIEVSHMNSTADRASSMHLQLNDPRDSELWLRSIRVATQKVMAQTVNMLDKKIVEYVARSLERERDYDPEHCHIFKIVQRASNRSAGRSSSDDLAKLSSTICYLAIGLNKIHVIPLERPTVRTSSTSLSDLETSMAFGIMTLANFSMHDADDAFQLTFCIPMRVPFAIHLASSAARDIAVRIREAADYLRPLWTHQPFVFQGPASVEEDLIYSHRTDEDEHGCFDRTLVAYCAGYEVDTSNIRYAIDYECEDAPCFNLLPPDLPHRGRYTLLELLAVFRALRYNETFHSISLNSISLDILQGLRDTSGIDGDYKFTKSGLLINIPGQDQMTLLSQEVRALALKSRRLRRIDFSYTIGRTPTKERGAHDPGCGIPEAIFPLCRRQLTNVDWVTLTGIKLGDSDLDYMVDAASQRASHLRALEIGDCEISPHDLDILLSALSAQGSTLESVNISGIEGRISPITFHQQISSFGHIRKLDLSRVQRTSGPQPLIAPETLMTWRLEELSLSRTSLNESTVDSISAYLACPKSDTLRNLRLEKCGLNGKDVAIFLQSMCREDGKPRNLHLHVSENRLHTGYEHLFDTIGKNKTCTHISMRMFDFQKEDHFRHLVAALTMNKTLKYLDISKALLPCDAGTETCEMLQQMFEENQTLEELDISGEYAHLEQVRFGIGLNLALTGLKRNKTLKVLRIEHQKLGLQGANTLASVLEENSSLLEVYCENNEINLQSFTVLLNALRSNQTVLYLPSMDPDRQQSLAKVQREIEAMNVEENHVAATKNPIKRTLTTVTRGSRSTGPATASQTPYSERDVQAALHALNERWDAEVDRLNHYLHRNFNIAHGVYEAEDANHAADTAETRPSTATSLAGLLERVKSDRTPTLEKEIELGDGIVFPDDLERTPPAKRMIS